MTSAPVTSAPVSSVQFALNLLSASLAHSALGKGVSGRGRGKGKGPLLLKCTFKSCTYSTFNKGDFRIHMDKHPGVRYRCGICPKDFGSNKAKETHIRTAHLGQHRANCPELGCNFSHNDHGVTRVHLYVEHGIGEEPKCKHPDYKGRDMFSNSESMKDLRSLSILPKMINVPIVLENLRALRSYKHTSKSPTSRK